MTPGLRELKERLSAGAELTGNRPLMQMGMSGGESEGVDDWFLSGRGIDLESASNQAVMSQKRLIATLMRRERDGESADSLEELWHQIATSIAVVDALDPPAHEEVSWNFWAAVSNAMERIFSAQNYDPSRVGHPDLDVATALLDRLAQSPHPAEREDRASMSWSTSDVRVYVASSFMYLARRWGSSRPALLDRVADFLGDSVSTVRHQISGVLNTLWDVDRERMWAMMLRVANEEPDALALAHFVASPLARVSPGEGDRAESMLSIIVNRFPSGSTDGTQLDQVIGGFVAELYVGEARAVSGQYIEQWMQDIDAGYPRLYAALAELRAALFMRFRQDAPADSVAIQSRARGVLERSVAAAVQVLASATAMLNDSTTESTERTLAEQRYKSSAQLLELACNQLYFGAGVFRNQTEPEPLGLPSVASMREFLGEYEAVLDAIGRGGPAGAVHHLVELYEFLSEAAPETVFDKISSLLLGPATQQGYHFEVLAVGVIVRIVRRYLADHRGIFEAVTRRADLIRVLRLFANAGWPEALGLLYELPSLLR